MFFKDRFQNPVYAHRICPRQADPTGGQLRVGFENSFPQILAMAGVPKPMPLLSRHVD
jgi:hypothetical protein